MKHVKKNSTKFRVMVLCLMAGFVGYMIVNHLASSADTLTPELIMDNCVQAHCDTAHNLDGSIAFKDDQPVYKPTADQQAKAIELAQQGNDDLDALFGVGGGIVAAIVAWLVIRRAYACGLIDENEPMHFADFDGELWFGHWSDESSR